MREDMLKVVTEPARRGSRYNHNLYRGAKKFKLDENLEVNDNFCRNTLPIRAKQLGWDGKEQQYNTAPIKRFLQSNVGRKWDDVYSEICKVFKFGQKVGYHRGRDFLTWYIEDAFLGEDGIVYSANNRWRSCKTSYVPIEEQCDTLYIDPRDGILKRTHGESYKSKNRRRYLESQKQDIDARDIKDENGNVIEKLRRIDGTWFRVFEEVLVQQNYYKQKPLEIIKKETLSKAELKAYGLK